jgi:hypothetical protein
MLVVGAVGLAVNVIALLLLRGGAEESLNVKGAYLEVDRLRHPKGCFMGPQSGSRQFLCIE